MPLILPIRNQKRGLVRIGETLLRTVGNCQRIKIASGDSKQPYSIETGITDGVHKRKIDD